MKTKPEQVVELIKRAIRLKIDSYLNKVNAHYQKCKNNIKVKHAVVATMEELKWKEKVMQAVEMFSGCTDEEQHQILAELTTMVDIQTKILAENPTSLEGLSTKDTVDMFLQKTQKPKTFKFGRK